MQVHEGHLGPSVANRLFTKPRIEGIQGHRELLGSLPLSSDLVSVRQTVALAQHSPSGHSCSASVPVLECDDAYICERETRLSERGHIPNTSLG